MWGNTGIIVFGAVAAVWATELIRWDITSQRLPATLTLPAAATLASWALVNGMFPALGGALLWAGGYGCVGIVCGGIGGGDIKLGVSLGIGVWLVAGAWGVITAMILASVGTLTVMVILRVPRAPHGPAMVLAALAVGIVG